VLPILLEDRTLDLDGYELQIIDVGQGDTEHSSIVYAPAIGAIVAGDVVYNQVHMMTAETDAASGEAWIANLDAIAALNPHHRGPGAQTGQHSRFPRDHRAEPRLPARLQPHR
jgi:hypothetical protein